MEFFIVSTPTVAAFKERLDDHWELLGYVHDQRPTA